MDEIWRSIKGYEGLYEVSNLGRVRSLGMWVNGKNGSKRFIKGRVLKPGKYIDGYLRVVLYKDGVMKTYRVHRLVAQAFLPNPDGLPIVNHKDENKENNRVDNLEWCDDKYSINYGTRTKKAAKAQSKIVYMYNLNDGLCGLWPSMVECSRNGFDQSAISNCCNGTRKSHRGFKWSDNPPKPLLALPYFEALPRS